MNGCALRARLKREDSRRSLNAQMIAGYLRETSATEGALLQRSRREDMLEADDLRVVPTPLSITTDATNDQASQGGWVELDVKLFGEF